MANVTGNLLVREGKGNVGKQFVYRKRGSKTHLGKMPTVNKNRPVTEDEVKKRRLFKSAAIYAKGAMSSPELKKEYNKKANGDNTGFNIAVRDYIKPPEVTLIETELYHGTPGDSIVVSAIDDFRVASVLVSIRSSAGVQLEQGFAVLNAVDQNKWTYTALQSNAVLVGTVITAVAKDLPGHTGTLVKTL